MKTIVHRSPAITAIFNAAKNNNKNKILDLSVGSSANLQFYAQLGYTFQFAGYDETIKNVVSGKLTETEALNAFSDDIDEQQRFDIVLLWDALNYLPESLAQKIMALLQVRLNPGALVHSIHFVSKSIPSRPSKYQIKNQYQIDATIADGRIPLSNKATTVKLLKLFPNYSVVRSFINVEGMAKGFSEHIFRFGEGAQEQGTVFSSAETSETYARVRSRMNSPALQSLMPAEESQDRGTLLDLGVRRTFNNDYFRQRFDRVITDDLQVTLQRYRKQPETFLKEGRFLDLRESTKVNLVLTWDLFNYCDEALLKEIGKRIHPHCVDGTRMVVMAYSGQGLPAAPQTFLVDSKGLGIAEQGSKPQLIKKKNKLTSMMIQKCFPGFFVEHSFAFRPGMQKGVSEYVFVFKDAARQEKERNVLREQVQARRKLNEKAADKA